MGDAPQIDLKLERIKTLTQTAKGVWFGYLGTLAFTGVTLLDVEDVDFFSLDSSTQLPLIGVYVPVIYFFGFGSILLVIVYYYLHVFLEKLWLELATVPARVDEQGKAISNNLQLELKLDQPVGLNSSIPIAQHIHPWLFSEFALFIRSWTRKENPTPIEMSPLGYIGVLASAILGWLAGPFVLFFFWLWSQTAHSFVLALICVVAFCLSIFVTCESYCSLCANMKGDRNRSKRGSVEKKVRRFRVCFAMLSILLIIYSGLRTEWDYRDAGARAHQEGYAKSDGLQWLRPTSAELAEAHLVELPFAWYSRDTATKIFYSEWCKRPDTTECNTETNFENLKKFQIDWRQTRSNQIRGLRKPKLSRRDLSFANLKGVFAPGIELSQSNLDGANLMGAQLEQADFFHASLERAILKRAQLYGVKLREANLTQADLRESNLEAADLVLAKMNGVIIGEESEEGEAFRGVNLRAADLRGAQLMGTHHNIILFLSADLRGSDFSYSAIRFADLTGSRTNEFVEFRNSFGDGSVILEKGMTRPCQWAAEGEELSDEVFFGRWRGWIEPYLPEYFGWEVVSYKYRDVDPIAPPEGCEWKTSPINASIP